MANAKASEVVITGVGCYMNLFTPRAFGSNEPKYSVCMLISKKDKKQLAKIQKAIQAAKEEAQTKNWNGKMYPDERLTLPIHDGDVERADDPAYKGMWYINCSNKEKPGVVNQNVEPILNTDEIYSGCIVNTSVNFYGYNNTGNIGISASLQAVQLVADGERLSGHKPASAIFSAVTEDDLADLDEYLKSDDLPDYFK